MAFAWQQRIESLVGFDLHLPQSDSIDPDSQMMVEGTVYDWLQHAIADGACGIEEAEDLITQLHKGIGSTALLHVL